jgi:5-methylcytosine-specific restriction endonuclease McrA
MGTGRPPWHGWYNTARWQELRMRVFTRDRFTCRMPGCGRLEGNTSRLVCDHIRAHRGDAALFWDEANLQTLCKPCHDGLKQTVEQPTLHQRGVWH